MSNARWESPFQYTLAFNLFKKHFTELNQAYWAFIPAYNTIKSTSKKSLSSDDSDPKAFFLIRDEDDRRIAPTYKEWCNDFSEFSNYSRLNMLMLLSSCFETYMRTVISLSFESKPGTTIMCPNAIDGAFILKADPSYGDMTNQNYRFSSQVEEVCKGEWSRRITAFIKYFGTPPESILSQLGTLDEFRTKRNNIGHYLGRNKKQYSAPILFYPQEAMRLSHDKLLAYFKMIYNVAKEFDSYLITNYIGSYDIIKCYFQKVGDGFFVDNKPGVKARELKHLIGEQGLPAINIEYYRNIVSYCDLDDSDVVCRYSMKSSISEINRQLTAKKVSLIRDGRSVPVGKYVFNLFIKVNNWRDNPDYCQRNTANSEQLEYRYSAKLIQTIVCEIEKSPNSIVEILQSRNAYNLK